MENLPVIEEVYNVFVHIDTANLFRNILFWDLYFLYLHLNVFVLRKYTLLFLQNARALR
jgi:hypothetical protein